jgi:hypothetical protein
MRDCCLRNHCPLCRGETHIDSYVCPCHKQITDDNLPLIESAHEGKNSVSAKNGMRAIIRPAQDFRR